MFACETGASEKFPEFDEIVSQPFGLEDYKGLRTYNLQTNLIFPMDNKLATLRNGVESIIKNTRE